MLTNPKIKYMNNDNMGKFNVYLTTSIARVWVAAIILGFIVLFFEAVAKFFKVFAYWGWE